MLSLEECGVELINQFISSKNQEENKIKIQKLEGQVGSGVGFPGRKERKKDPREYLKFQGTQGSLLKSPTKPTKPGFEWLLIFFSFA